jgi:hypothetical protein
MGQNNSLRILERILTIATSDSKSQEKFGSVLLKSMNLDIQPENMVDFYGVLSRARDEAASIRKERIERYIKTLDECNISITAGRDGGLPKDEKSGLTKR